MDKKKLSGMLQLKGLPVYYSPTLIHGKKASNKTKSIKSCLLHRLFEAKRELSMDCNQQQKQTECRAQVFNSLNCT